MGAPQEDPSIAPPLELAYARQIPRPRPPGHVRLIAAIVFAACAGILGLAVKLRPDPRGYGTHQQLRMAPCGMLIAFGIPCPTCGMTTAYAHTVRGNWLRALYAQPAGFVFALATIVCGTGSLWSLVTGRPPRVPGQAITPYRIFLAILILLVGGWGAKIAIGWIDGTLPIQTPIRVS